MKISDIVELAKAGYKPKDVLTLLEYVENSPKVQEAAPITPDEVPNNTPDPTPVPSDDVKKVDDIETLKKLLED
jgi:hypothetical protein